MFANRTEAGQRLARKIRTEFIEEENQHDVLVLSIPRGGVVLGVEIAKELAVEHDIIVTKKLRAPGHEELAIGAVGRSDASVYRNDALIAQLGLSQDYLRKEIENRQIEVNRRLRQYCGDNTEKEEGARSMKARKRLRAFMDRVCIIVDDGVATGATMIAAVREVFAGKPHRVVVAVPVIAKDTLALLEQEADAVIFLVAPDDFFAVGQFYRDFEEVSDEEVRQFLKKV